MIDQTNIGITGYIPFGYFRVWPATAGSTYLRFDQMNALDPSFEPWIHGKKYDNLIFQKAYWTEMMDVFGGPKILDICDPDWIREYLDILEVCKRVHAVTCSSPELTRLMKTYLPDRIVEHVPDRLNLDAFPVSREKHEGGMKKAVWFGYIHNAHETLEQLATFLKENQLNLRIIADAPYAKEDEILAMNPEFIPYDQKMIYEQLKEADVVLNPRSEKAAFRFKSNNKSLIGWQLGLPVAQTTDDLQRLMDPMERNREVEEKQEMIIRDYDIHQSIGQYRSLMARIRKEFF